jgi:hypothetical protein
MSVPFRLLLAFCATSALLSACSTNSGESGGPAPADNDGDGYVIGVDCDDWAATVHPDAVEVCNGRDDNCDNVIDEGATTTFWLDADGDGFGDPKEPIEDCLRPDGYSTVDTDCDDTNPDVRPAVPEICDGLDQDCDGEIDEGAGDVWYHDADADSWGNEDDTTTACSQPDDYLPDFGDCNDDDATIYPDAVEICDGLDNNCNGVIDEGAYSHWYPDRDGDGYGDVGEWVDDCAPPLGYVGEIGDCNDADATIHPDADEACDDIDNDCDGETDEIGLGSLYFDGAGDEVYIADNPLLALTTAITMEAWVDHYSPGSADSPVLAKEYTSGAQQYWFGVYRGHFGLLIGNGSGWGLDARSSGTITGHNWYHIASVWDGTTWYNYLNGALQGSGSYSGTIASGTQPLTMGINSGWDSTRFTGFIYDVRLWNVARTADQILANMYGLTDSAGLVGHWLLDEGYGQTAYDTSGNALDGRLGSTPEVDDRDPTRSTDLPGC